MSNKTSKNNSGSLTPMEDRAFGGRPKTRLNTGITKNLTNLAAFVQEKETAKEKEKKKAGKRNTRSSSMSTQGKGEINLIF